MKIKKLFGEDIDISQEDFGVEVGKTINSPNRFHQFHDLESLFNFIEKEIS